MRLAIVRHHANQLIRVHVRVAQSDKMTEELKIVLVITSATIMRLNQFLVTVPIADFLLLAKFKIYLTSKRSEFLLYSTSVLYFLLKFICIFLCLRSHVLVIEIVKLRKSRVNRRILFRWLNTCINSSQKGSNRTFRITSPLEVPNRLIFESSKSVLYDMAVLRKLLHSSKLLSKGLRTYVICFRVFHPLN